MNFRMWHFREEYIYREQLKNMEGLYILSFHDVESLFLSKYVEQKFLRSGFSQVYTILYSKFDIEKNKIVI